MKSLRTDLIVLALIVSVALHLGIMYYMRPMVMTQVTAGVRSPVKKGPMRVVRTTENPDPVLIAAVMDVKPEKEAPEAEKGAVLTPSAETALPVGGETSTDVPEAARPELALDEALLGELPEVRTVDFSPVASREPKMGGLQTVVKPTDVLSKLPTATADALAVPLVLPSMPPLAAAPSGARASAPALPERAPAAPTPAFKPSAEVMEKVDEKVVEAEKAAVRDLVDIPDAKDLADFVDVKVARSFGEKATHFRVTLTPKTALTPVPKDFVVLIDASGSIGRERMGSIRGAAKRILRSAANTGDRFNLVAFRDRYSYAFRSWQECTESSFAAADRWLGNVAPFGRTDVFATIASVLTLPREPSRPLVALVVTDGDANSGVSETADILSKFTTLNDGLVSVYMYGVKASANRELIDVLTRGNRGESFIFQDKGWFSRVHAGEGLEGLSNRFRDPVLSDLRVVFASDCAAEAYPRLLRNMYRGNSVEIVGQVPAGTREIAFSLKGLNGREAYEGYFRLPLDSAASDPTLPGTWAAERAIDRQLR